MMSSCSNSSQLWGKTQRRSFSFRSSTALANSLVCCLRMPRYGGKRKKRRTHKAEDESNSGISQAVPQSLVFRQGKVAKPVAQLVMDLRKVMEPYTGTKLQESRKNKLKDFIHVASGLGVTHMVSIQHHDLGPTLRILKSPKGPTLTFRISQYSLVNDIMAMQRKPHSPGASNEYLHAPLVVLNGFSGTDPFKQLLSTTLQNMFPPIDVNNLDLKQCRRVVLFNLLGTQKDDQGQSDVLVDMRHYLINASPVGIKKTVKKIVKGKVPNLGRFKDMEDYVLHGQDLVSSDSEAEEGSESLVVLPQNFVGAGNVKSQSSAVRLKEIGPRITMKLLKIEDGVSSGMVLYHHSITKSESEMKEQDARKAQKEMEKARRRSVQQRNVESKESKKRKRESTAESDEETSEDDVVFDEAVDDSQ
jgi:ribosome biogenesis protein SSF1/2